MVEEENYLCGRTEHDVITILDCGCIIYMLLHFRSLIT